MNEKIFSGVVHVVFQGSEPIKLKTIHYEKGPCSEYSICGFNSPTAVVHDYRFESNKKLSLCLSGHSAKNFFKYFNIISNLSLTINNGEIQVEMYDTSKTTTSYVLWTAIGMNNAIPNYDYIFKAVAPLDNGLLGFISLYKRQYSLNGAK